MSPLPQHLRKISLVGVALLLGLTLFIAACSALPDINSGNVATPAPTPSVQSTVPGTSAASQILQIVPPRPQSSMAYDEKRNVTILFGGNASNDTWRWDGKTWTRLHPASMPTARSEASMAYDAAHARVILFGGIGAAGTPLSDTWSWDGANWLPLSPAISPPSLGNASLVYDAAHQRLVLFGGQILTSGQASSPTNATWTWDGTNWTKQQSQISPPPRAQASMTYDAAHQQVLLFGGSNGVSNLNDTWTWNGSTWSELHPATMPTARAGSSLVYDAATQQIILFAGAGSANIGDLSETWLWDGQTWISHPTSKAPAGPYTVAAYDTAQQMIVAYVVHNQNQTVSNSETWLWDGKAWTMYA